MHIENMLRNSPGIKAAAAFRSVSNICEQLKTVVYIKMTSEGRPCEAASNQLKDERLTKAIVWLAKTMYMPMPMEFWSGARDTLTYEEALQVLESLLWRAAEFSKILYQSPAADERDSDEQVE